MLNSGISMKCAISISYCMVYMYGKIILYRLALLITFPYRYTNHTITCSSMHVHFLHCEILDVNNGKSIKIAINEWWCAQSEKSIVI